MAQPGGDLPQIGGELHAGRPAILGVADAKDRRGVDGDAYGGTELALQETPSVPGDANAAAEQRLRGCGPETQEHLPAHDRELGI
jgi:hypothetical protein